MMSDKKHDILKRQFCHMIENTGMSLMDEQKDILRIFCATENHVTIQDMQEKIRQEHKELPYELIKATLDMFQQYGIAHKRVFQDGHEIYEHRHLQEHHDHMICVRCGKVTEFSENKIEKLQDDAAERENFHPLWHTLEIYGICHDCFRKYKRTIPLAFAPAGERVKIVNILGGHGVRKRLADMGLISDSEIRVINNTGPFIVAVKGSRIAIGLGIARKIVVIPIDSEKKEKK